jgi:hypothetical protein
VQRNGTVLIALLAVVALAAAAGGFTAGVGGPLTSGTGLGDGGGAPDSGPAPSATGGGGGSGLIGTVGESAGGGGSVLLVAGFVGALVCALVLAVALTGDDERAPRPESDAPERAADPRPAVEVRYRAPEDNLVVRAWDRLAGTVGQETTETPGETAHRAADAGFSRETVERLAEGFRAVRYGGEPPEGRERVARETLDELERQSRGTDERGEEA